MGEAAGLILSEVNDTSKPLTRSVRYLGYRDDFFEVFRSPELTAEGVGRLLPFLSYNEVAVLVRHSRIDLSALKVLTDVFGFDASLLSVVAGRSDVCGEVLAKIHDVLWASEVSDAIIANPSSPVEVYLSALFESNEPLKMVSFESLARFREVSSEVFVAFVKFQMRRTGNCPERFDGFTVQDIVECFMREYLERTSEVIRLAVTRDLLSSSLADLFLSLSHDFVSPYVLPCKAADEVALVDTVVRCLNRAAEESFMSEREKVLWLKLLTVNRVLTAEGFLRLCAGVDKGDIIADFFESGDFDETLSEVYAALFGLSGSDVPSEWRRRVLGQVLRFGEVGES